MITLHIVAILWAGSAGQVESCDAIAACDASGHCEGAILEHTCTARITLDECLSEAEGWPSDDEHSEEPWTVLGCSPDAMILVMEQ